MIALDATAFVAAPEAKDCENCGTPFERAPGVPAGLWRKRRFCTPLCRQTKYHRDNPEGLSDPRDAAEKGSRFLLIELLRYGVKHDGLPGLTADQFRALAGQHGVAL